MAFKRIIQVDIGQNNNTGVRISNLNLSFETERSVDFESNFGNFKIYNAKKETRNKTLIKGNNLFLRCGYEDENNLALVFAGYIVESSSKLEGTEWVTDLVVRDIGNNVDNVIKAKKSLNYSSNTRMSVIVNDIANIIDVPIIGLNNISNVVLNNGFVFTGSYTNALKKLNKIAGINNVGIYFDQSELVIYLKGTQDTRFGVVTLSPRSGLLGEVEEITDELEPRSETKEAVIRKIVRFTSLLNPKLKPNTVIKLDSNKVKGAFIIERVKNVGDNLGGDFVTQGEAL